MYYFIFSFVVLIAIILGSLAGIGGGVIIRPALDAFNYFDESAITNMISTFCVLFGCATTVIKKIISKQKIDNYKTAISLGVGAVIGGVCGQLLFTFIEESSNKNILIITQSVILIILSIFSVVYMQFFKPKGKCLHLKNIIISLIIGIFLGISSSFLGIGGGPINVAILCLFFGMNMMEASINSTIVIVFSQVSKLVQTFIDGTFQKLCNLESLSANDQTWWIFVLILVPISVIGSLIGSFIAKKCNEKALIYIYYFVNVLIVGINIYNIVSNALVL